MSVVSSKKEGQKEDISNALPLQPVKHLFSPKSRSIKKVLDDDIADNGQYDVIDTTYAYIEFRNDIKTWKDGKAVVDKVADLLKVPRELFIKERVDRNEVTFKVKEPNQYGLNGTEVARRIENIKDELGKATGVVITSTGIGDKSKLPSAERLDARPDHEVYVVTVIVCGVLAALALSAGVLYLTRRHGYKLANMTSGDAESSKLYQDLCRARMSTKNTTPAGQSDSAPAAQAQRIASLSKESDKDSPSSRSSTSSWATGPVTSVAAVLGYGGWHFGAGTVLDQTQEKFFVPTLTKIAMGFITRDFILNTSITNGSLFSGSIYHQVNSQVELGVIISWSAETSTSDFGLGCKIVLEPDTTLRFKVDDKATVGMSYSHQFKKGVSLCLSAQISAKSFKSGGSKIGVALELEP